jgi:hypothetical protein
MGAAACELERLSRSLRHGAIIDIPQEKKHFLRVTTVLFVGW